MKIYLLALALFLSGRMSAAQPDALTFSLECDGRKIVCTQLSQVMFGGPTQHFFVVRDARSAFDTLRVRFEAKPSLPSVPYLAIGTFTFPLSHFGVYLVRKEGERVIVDFLRADLPKGADRSTVEEFIRSSLAGQP